MPERVRLIDFPKLKEQIEAKDRSFYSLIKFDLQFYIFSVLQLILINILIFKTVSIMTNNSTNIELGIHKLWSFLYCDGSTFSEFVHEVRGLLKVSREQQCMVFNEEETY